MGRSFKCVSSASADVPITGYMAIVARYKPRLTINTTHAIRSGRCINVFSRVISLLLFIDNQLPFLEGARYVIRL